MNNSVFTNLEKLNESATTTVYKAFQPSLERFVLLKILHKHLATDAVISERFKREARSLAKLRSEHIVQVHELTEIEDAPAIVMEFVEGSSLKSLLEEKGIQSLDFVKKIAVHVLRGLAIAHEHGIIHRDIKPGNILVNKKGIVKVTDFGLAAVAQSTSVTMEGLVLGTPAYMSPEQIRGDELSGRTDIFSLGITLVELFTGKKIFDGNSYSECVKKISSFKASELNNTISNAPQEFIALMEKMLEPNLQKRYENADEALAAFGEKRSNAVKIAEAETKKRKIFPVIIAAIALAVFVGIIFLLQNNQPLPQPDEKQTIVASDSVQKQNDTPKKNNNGNLNKQVLEKKSENIVVQNPHNIVPANLTANTLPDSGFLSLAVVPWAKVYVNDQYIGETPIASAIKIPTGTYSILFSNPMFEPIVKRVEIKSKEQQTVEANFLEHAGYFLPHVTPWAEIYVDDQYRETTPLSKPIVLSSGKRKIRFHNPAFEDVVKEIIVSVKDTLRFSVSYK